MSSFSTDNVIKYQDINLSDIKYNIPKKIKGKYIASTRYNKKKLITITPKLKNISGIMISEDRCHIILEIDNKYKQFYDFIISLDEYNQHIVCDKSFEWFGQSFPIDIVDDYYKSIVKLNKNNVPIIKLKIPFKNNKILINIVNQLNQPIDHLEVISNQFVTCVIQYNGLHFLNQQFSPIWTINALKIYNKNVKYIFNNISDNDSDNYSDYSDNETTYTTNNIDSNTSKSDIHNTELDNIELDNLELNNIELDNIELDNIELNNIELDNIELDNIELNNIELDNIELNNIELDNIELNNVCVQNIELDNVCVDNVSNNLRIKKIGGRKKSINYNIHFDDNILKTNDGKNIRNRRILKFYKDLN
jgi:hypothetical protein